VYPDYCICIQTLSHFSDSRPLTKLIVRAGGRTPRDSPADMSTSLFTEVIPEINANPEHKRLNLYTRALLLLCRPPCWNKHVATPTNVVRVVTCRGVTQQIESGLICHGKACETNNAAFILNATDVQSAEMNDDHGDEPSLQLYTCRYKNSLGTSCNELEIRWFSARTYRVSAREQRKSGKHFICIQRTWMLYTYIRYYAIRQHIHIKTYG